MGRAADGARRVTEPSPYENSLLGDSQAELLSPALPGGKPDPKDVGIKAESVRESCFKAINPKPLKTLHQLQEGGHF